MEQRTRLEEARWRAGKSRSDVAEKVGVSAKTIGRWETGRTACPLYAAAEIAELLGVTLDWLAGEDEPTEEVAA